LLSKLQFFPCFLGPSKSFYIIFSSNIQVLK
jgi:hypothetical protein